MCKQNDADSDLEFNMYSSQKAAIFTLLLNRAPLSSRNAKNTNIRKKKEQRKSSRGKRVEEEVVVSVNDNPCNTKWRQAGTAGEN